jgi:molybdopterin molybdotransferase
MISVSEAQQLIIKHSSASKPTTIALKDALNYVLTEDITAPIPIPPFNQSAVDGYAFCFNTNNNSYTIVDEIPAGDTRKIDINANEAARIFTGSKVPENCDTVIMQEFTKVENNQLFIDDENLKTGGNIRTKGYQIKQGDTALSKGNVLNPAAIGFLATLGITEVSVFTLPKVSILITGNELVAPGEKLDEGQIYESNSLMLKAAFEKMNISPTISYLKDNQEATTNAITNALNNADMVILSGGISVGDYDFVQQGILENGVSQIFYKVAQKPGKPLFFGKKENKAVFGLPGNPAAALTCFYEYIYPYINLSFGLKQAFLNQLQLPLSKDIKQKPGRATFLKATTDFKTVTPLEGQNSDALQSFAYANALLLTPADAKIIKKGELVNVHLLP